MKHLLLILILSYVSISAQIKNDNIQLLPDRMIFTQRILWGENGLMRNGKSFELNQENRIKELNIREKLFLTHRILGYVTAVEMIASVVVGVQLYNGHPNLKNAHNALVTATNITYFSALTISLFSPPGSRGNRRPALAIHKILSTIHLAGMITTNILGSVIENNPNLKNAHRAIAIATFSSFEIAALVIHF